MQKILLLDDDLLVIQAIKQKIQWGNYGIEEVFLCNNVEVAKDIVRREKIVLVISDIEMPGQDGLQFAKWLKGYDETIKVILLTAFPEFRYAQVAVTLGVEAYLLKPVMYDVLEKLLAESMAKIAQMQFSRDIHRVYEENKGEFVRNYVHYILKENRRFTKEELHSHIKEFGLDFSFENMYVVIWLCFKDSKDISWERQSQIKQMLKTAFTCMASDMIMADLDEKRILGMLVLKKNQLADIVKIRECMSEMIVAWKEVVSCYMSDCSSFEQIPSILLKMKERDEKNVIYQNKVFLVGNRNIKICESVVTDYRKWYSLLENGRFDELEKKIDFDIHNVVLNGVMDHEKLYELLSNFMRCVYRFLGENYDMFKALISDESYVRLEKKAGNSVDDFRAFYSNYLKALKMSLNQGRNKEVIEKVKAYVEEHMDEKISREDIADSVSLNESYLSRVFRKETGESLSDYILHRKISRAKVMLIQTNLSVSTIAERLGYDASAYFTKMFKREVGKTPKEYRKEVQI